MTFATASLIRLLSHGIAPSGKGSERSGVIAMFVGYPAGFARPFPDLRSRFPNLFIRNRLVRMKQGFPDRAYLMVCRFQQALALLR